MEKDKYKTAAAFRVALETRIRAVAAERELAIGVVRLKVAMERLLARLFHSPAARWLLKGGLATELRYRPRARTTRDVDLAISSNNHGAKGSVDIAELHAELVLATRGEHDEYFQFRIEAPKRELQGAPEGGARFLCECILAGKSYAKFHLDVGVGDVFAGEPETLVCEEFLAFAGIQPATVLAIPLAQQFAEKIHAYTFPWKDRLNTRVKDMVDLILYIERTTLGPEELKRALILTFERRNTHSLPEELPTPPSTWAAEFAAMAKQAALQAEDVGTGYQVLKNYWDELGVKNESGAIINS